MELDQIDAAGAGFCPSVDERAMLEVLFATQLREQPQLASLRYWGRVWGTKQDYIIAAATLKVQAQPGYTFFYWWVCGG